MKNLFFILSFLIYLFGNAQNFTLGWAKGIGGTADWDAGESIVKDASGNIYTTGYFSGTVDFDPGPGVFNLVSTGTNVCIMGGCSDIFVSKFDASGNFIWARAIGSVTDDMGKSIALDASGNIIVFGIFTGTADFDPGAGVFNISSAGSLDVFICKLDASGNFIWAKGMGGTSIEYAYSVTTDLLGNIYTTGLFSGVADFDPGSSVSNLTSNGNSDIFISKLDASGNFVYAKSIGSTSDDRGTSIVIGASGNVYISGLFGGTADFDPGAGSFNLSSAGQSDIFFCKLDASGNFIVAKRIGGSGVDEALSFTLDNMENVYATGTFDGAVDFDPNVGTFNLTDNGAYSCFILKLDALYSFVWAKVVGGTNSTNDVVKGVSIRLDASGNVYTAGDFSGIIDFDPGSSVFNLNASTGISFAVELSNSGNFISVTKITEVPSSGGSNVHGIVVDAYGAIYSTGEFTGTVDFDPGTATYTFSGGAADIFLSKLCQLATPTITSSGPASFCSSTSLTLTSSSATNYLWSNGATTQSIVVSGSGNYSVTVSSANGCSSSSAVFSATALPVPVFSYTTSAMVASFTKTGSGCSTFLWDFGNGNTSSINPNPVVTYATAGTYNVCLQCNSTGCVSCLTITVPSTSSGAIGINETLQIKNNIVLYPNPVSDLLTIMLPEITSAVQVKLFNTTGEVLFEKQYSDIGIFNLEMRNIGPGIYFLEVIGSREISRVKFVKQ